MTYETFYKEYEKLKRKAQAVNKKSKKWYIIVSTRIVKK